MKLILDFILIIGILLNLIVLVGLIRLEEKKLPQKILIILWLIILINILHSYSALHNLRYFNRTTFIFEDGSRFIGASLIFIYLKSLFFKHTNFIKKNFVHFIPFVLYLILFTLPRLVNILSEPDVFKHVSIIDQSLNLALVKDLYFLVYCFLSLKLFYSVKGNMKYHYSNINEKDFSWLEKFLISISLVIMVDFIITLLEIYFEYNVTWDGFITLIFLVISVAYLGYYGLKQSTIFLPYLLLEKQHKKRNNKVLKSTELSEVLKRKIEDVLKTEKNYLSPDLTLRMLAEKINLSERKLSSFLNNEMQISFYDFINSYRIIEAKRRLLSNAYEKYTIEGIGHSCGFNSRSSFFKVFKKETGISPTTYKKTAKK
ncbi:MAG: hypothetical protein COB60_12520 [Flavobacteriaceae bacterium]|nr:MAG: hypothetical protein COB60_12520 [Flavobacteriaceae bacterium]